MYHILDEPKGKDHLDQWIEATGEFELIKCYSDLGDLFLINPKTNEIGVLLTMDNSFNSMGYYDWDGFFEKVMQNPDFQERAMKRPLIEQVNELLGDLDEEEIYIPRPYPCLGGSGSPESYTKGNVWVYLAISSQTFTQL